MSANGKKWFEELRVNSWEIEKLFYEGYEYVEPERSGYIVYSDSTVLAKAADSLIHIPFYIYR